MAHRLLSDKRVANWAWRGYFAVRLGGWGWLLPLVLCPPLWIRLIAESIGNPVVIGVVALLTLCCLVFPILVGMMEMSVLNSEELKELQELAQTLPVVSRIVERGLETGDTFRYRDLKAARRIRDESTALARKKERLQLVELELKRRSAARDALQQAVKGA